MNSTTRSSGGWKWALIPTLVVSALLFAPLAVLLRLSVTAGGGMNGGSGFYEAGTWTLTVWRKLLRDPYFQEVCLFTVQLGLVVTAVCLLVGYPVAIAIRGATPRWKPWLLAGIVIPKLSNLLVTVYGLKLILGDHGPVNRFLSFVGVTIVPLALQNNLAGVIIGKTLLVLPYTVLFLWIGLEQIDRRIPAAARGLGASRWQTFRLVTLPLSLPALHAAALISLIWACGAFISPYLLGSPQQITLSVDVQRQMFDNRNWPRAAAEGIALVALISIISSTAAAVGRWLQSRSGHTL